MRSKFPWSVGLIALLLATLTVGSTRSAVANAAITVTTTDDEVNTDGDCSLREAIRAANTNQAVDNCPAGGDNDQISVPAGTYTFTRSGSDNTASRGDLDLLGTTTLSGVDAATTIIDANRTGRVIDVRPEANVTIQGLTMRNGVWSYDEYDPDPSGMALRNLGRLVLHNSVVSDSGGPSEGGGIMNYGALTIANSAIQNNGAWFGGGVHNVGTLTVIDTTFHDNYGDTRGGGLNNVGVAEIRGSIFSENASQGESEASGGAIANSGTLLIAQSEIRDNAGDWGGGVFNDQGEVAIIDTAIYRNEYQNGYGGGLYNSALMTVENSRIDNNTGLDDYGGHGAGVTNLGLLTIRNSTIRNNRARSDRDFVQQSTGGGIFNIGTVQLEGSTVSGNAAFHGGGIVNGGTVQYLPPFGGESVTSPGILVARNSTISGNSATVSGGGMYNGDTGSSNRGNIVTLNNVTLAHNLADVDQSGNASGDEIFNSYNDTVHIRNTLIANNAATTSPSSCSHRIISGGYNLIGNAARCPIDVTTGDLINVDPQLGPLQDNGGPTPTHALLPGSPAIDAANPMQPGSSLLACEALDQRGVLRPQDGNDDGIDRCDIGAYERQTTRMMARRALLPMIYR